MIVADASIIVSALLSTGGAGARARERLRQGPDLHVPHLLDVEVTAALRRRVRLGHTDSDTAVEVLGDLADLPATRWDHEPLLRRVGELRDNVTAYDACYVVLAEMLGAELVTSDVRLGRAPGLRCAVDVLTD
ncbi:MAG: type II toxin-antitoxin system VapC family toxin [Micrococcales bacterium]|nr:type II toxin-antitoxin system VapC family toxin [Micrococcales bacterium]